MSAPADAEPEELERVGKHRNIYRFVDFEREEAAEAHERAPAGMIGIDRVMNLDDMWMSLEPLGYGKGTVHMALEAQRQGAKSTGQQKSFKRRELGAEVRVSKGIDPVDEMRSASDDARHRIAVASDIVGGRAKQEIGSVAVRRLVDES